jgi:hypothetical protein
MIFFRDGPASDKDGCSARLKVTPSRKALPLHLGNYVDSKDLHVVIRNTGAKILDLILRGTNGELLWLTKPGPMNLPTSGSRRGIRTIWIGSCRTMLRTLRCHRP